MVEVFMPKAGMDMQEGTLIRWLKEVGDTVEINEPIMEIETDKITMEAESPGNGILLAKTVENGAVVPVLAVMGYIGAKDEKIPEVSANVAEEVKEQNTPDKIEVESDTTKLSNGSDIAATPYAKKLAGEMGVELAQVSATGKHGEILGRDVKATPLAKKVAADMGVDLAGVSGSGHAGKVMRDDVLGAAAATTGEATRKPLSSMRKVISQRMTKSHQEIPVVTQHMKVDVTKLLELRAMLNENRESKLSLNDFVLKVVAQAVKEHPDARTSIEGNEYIIKEDVNIGFAVGMEEGLLVPVIKNADIMSLSNISKKAKELAKTARAGSLKPENLAGGTFTVSNMGMFDVYAFTPIINQPESGILGVCSIEDELALVEGEVVVKKKMMISLTFDHRIMDGIGAVSFQRRIKELLENPMEALI